MPEPKFEKANEGEKLFGEEIEHKAVGEIDGLKKLFHDISSTDIPCELSYEAVDPSDQGVVNEGRALPFELGDYKVSLLKSYFGTEEASRSSAVTNDAFYIFVMDKDSGGGISTDDYPVVIEVRTDDSVALDAYSALRVYSGWEEDENGLKKRKLCMEARVGVEADHLEFPLKLIPGHSGEVRKYVPVVEEIRGLLAERIKERRVAIEAETERAKKKAKGYAAREEERRKAEEIINSEEPED